MQLLRAEGITSPKGYIDGPQQGVKIATFGNDGDIGIEFFLEDLLLEGKTQLAGYPVYEKNVEMIRYHIDKLTKPVERVSEAHKRKYPDLYEKFRRGIGDGGLRIERWEGATFGEKHLLHSQAIATVEQLAAISDSKLASLPPGIKELRDRAKRYVAADQGTEAAKPLMDEIAKLRAELAALKGQVIGAPEGYEEKKTEGDEVAPTEQPEAPKKRRGRPKKIEG